MKKIAFIISMLLIIFLSGTAFSQQQVPHEIAGFRVGTDISEYKDRVRMDTVLPIRYAEFLKEVEIRDMKGYKSGLIIYGDCAQPGRIVRIKLKYADPSLEFFQMLLERFKERFGKPDKWRGDPFHVVRAWKWGFIDKEGNNISLILQHNTKDSTEKMGNAVKLSMLNLEKKELQCYEKKHPAEEKPDRDDIHPITPPINWEWYIPQ